VVALNPFVVREAPRYYGLPLFAQRLVFVMDTSGSMEGPRLPAAQRELITALGELQESTYFGIVVFNNRVAVWKKELVPATSENRGDAIQFIANQRAAGTTASYDALEAALNFDAEAMYFLTDGAPYGGKTDDPLKIVEFISQENSSRRMTVNALGIGVGPPGSPFALFLRALAERNHGEFRSVDQ
jgi:Mg-chelatase subunit ChlD